MRRRSDVLLSPPPYMYGLASTTSKPSRRRTSICRSVSTLEVLSPSIVATQSMSARRDARWREAVQALPEPLDLQLHAPHQVHRRPVTQKAVGLRGVDPAVAGILVAAGEIRVGHEAQARPAAGAREPPDEIRQVHDAQVVGGPD